MDFIDEAVKIAGRSSIGKHKTGAIFVRNGEIISNGWSHVPHYKLHSKKRSLHAELHALARARHLNLNGVECYVATLVSRNDNRVNGKPCLDCAIALKTAGIIWVTYTHQYLGVVDLNLSDPSTFDDLKVYDSNSI